jgi:hypothetical protein
MSQVELTITVRLEKSFPNGNHEWSAMLTGIKSPIKVSGSDRLTCIEKAIEKIINPEMFDIILIDPYETDLLR